MYTVAQTIHKKFSVCILLTKFVAQLLEKNCLRHKSKTMPANCFLTDHFLFRYQEQHRVDNSI